MYADSPHGFQPDSNRVEIYERDSYRRDQAFFLRFAIAIFAFVVFAFAQWALRGFANYATLPVAVHVHWIAMLGWMGLFVVQNYLAGRGSLALHRKLGWVGVALAVFVAVIGTYVTIEAIRRHRVPPIFTDPYFLVLGPVHTYFFLATLFAAIFLRRQTQWHRRLMLVATVLLLEPAFGRLVPFPILSGPLGPWTELLLQLGVLAIAMVHDWRVRGGVHPALWWGAGVVTLCVTTVVALSQTTTVAALAAGYAAS